MRGIWVLEIGFFEIETGSAAGRHAAESKKEKVKRKKAKILIKSLIYKIKLKTDQGLLTINYSLPAIDYFSCNPLVYQQIRINIFYTNSFFLTFVLFVYSMGEYYPNKINKRFRDHKYAGLLENFDAKGKWASFLCGVSVEFYLSIDQETKEIKAAKFKTNGCGYVIATADFLAQSVGGQKLTGLHGLDDLKNLVNSELDEIPPARIHCIDLCFDSLQNALAEYRLSQIGEWTGEKALICTCFGVSEETIENAIKAGGLETVEEVGDTCNAGTGCGSCQPLITEILDSEKDF